MIERPNKEAIVDALDIYRDAMRPFILRCLKRVPGGSVKIHMNAALRDEQYNQFQQNLSNGRSVEEAIDISDFPQIVKRYWRDGFRDAVSTKQGKWEKDALQRIVEARNKVAHPESRDIELKYTLDRLRDIHGLLSAINDPERAMAVEKILKMRNPFTTHAYKLIQGGRDVYGFVLDLESLNKRLPARVDDRVVKDANRPLTPSHAKNIQRYLEERNDWILGPLLLGISPDSVDFEPYTDPEAEFLVGRLRIDTDAKVSMKMFDGQHRRRAIRDVLEDLSQSRRHLTKLSILKEASLPIMLYVEDSIDNLRQMFADAAQARPIEQNTVTRFDQRDAFNVVALRVAEDSALFAGRVEMERASVARSSQNIIAINQLAMTLKTLEVGYGGRVKRERNDEFMLDPDSLYDRCLVWADEFMPACRDEYSSLVFGRIKNSDIPGKRGETMAFNATVIRIIAGCYYKWTQLGYDCKELANFLCSISLRPGFYTDSLFVNLGIVAPGGTSPFGSPRLVVPAIDRIIEIATRIKEAK